LEVNELFEENFWIKIKLDKVDVYIRKYIVWTIFMKKMIKAKKYFGKINSKKVKRFNEYC
jgi:hypothetical protein